MLGFASIAETPLSQGSPGGGVFAYLITAGAQGLTQDLLYTAIANVVSPYATASLLQGNTSYNAKASTSISNQGIQIYSGSIDQTSGSSNITLGTPSYLAVFVNDFSQINSTVNLHITPVPANILAEDVLTETFNNLLFSSVAAEVLTNSIDATGRGIVVIDDILGEVILTPLTSNAVNIVYNPDDYKQSRTYFITAQDSNRLIVINEQDANRTVVIN